MKALLICQSDYYKAPGYANLPHVKSEIPIVLNGYRELGFKTDDIQIFSNLESPKDVQKALIEIREDAHDNFTKKDEPTVVFITYSGHAITHEGKATAILNADNASN